MPQISINLKNLNPTQKAILSTLSFFHIYKLPLNAERIWQLLYRRQATLAEVMTALVELENKQAIKKSDGLYSLEDFDAVQYRENQEEVVRRWKKVRKYYGVLSAIPFVESICIINSVAMGNADHESDIDFFVIVKPGRLYFIRTMVIILFKLLGVYKTRTKVNEQFCFGFYVTSDNIGLKDLLLEGEDPYMVYWMGTLVPIFGLRTYEKFMRENQWLRSFLPNFRPQQRLDVIEGLNPSRILRAILQVTLIIPALLLEPVLRQIHIRHTFKLPENHWKTSSTIANRKMLKLHALDPRLDLKAKYERILARFL